jgi:hypothetical protein
LLDDEEEENDVIDDDDELDELYVVIMYSYPALCQ